MGLYMQLVKRADAEAANSYLEGLAGSDAGKASLGKATGGEWLARGAGAAGLGGLGWLLGRAISKKNKTLRWVLAALGAGAGGLGADTLLKHLPAYDGAKMSYRDVMRLAKVDPAMGGKINSLLNAAKGAVLKENSEETATPDRTTAYTLPEDTGIFGMSFAPYASAVAGLHGLYKGIRHPWVTWLSNARHSARLNAVPEAVRKAAIQYAADRLGTTPEKVVNEILSAGGTGRRPAVRLAIQEFFSNRGETNPRIANKLVDSTLAGHMDSNGKILTAAPSVKARVVSGVTRAGAEALPTYLIVKGLEGLARWKWGDRVTPRGLADLAKSKYHRE